MNPRFPQVALLIALGIALPSPALARPPQSVQAFRISGVVTSSRDGSPVARCSLRLSPATEDTADGSEAQGNRQGRAGRFGFGGAPGDRAGAAGRRAGDQQADREPVLTDAHGHFSMVVPRAGAWTLTGMARGFRTQQYEQHEQFSTALVVSPAHPDLHVEMVLRPASLVTGFVLDEFGDAVQGGQVVAQRRTPPQFPGGPVQWSSSGFASTDDRGHYELGNLADGEYRVAVSARPWYASSGGSSFLTRRGAPAAQANSSPLDPSLDVVFPVTWFPGTTEERSADLLTLHAGEDRQADFHLQAVPAFHLDIPRPPERASQGTDSDVPIAIPQVTRESTGSLPFGGGGGQFSVNRDGSWEIDGLAPGKYQIWLPGNASGKSGPVEVDLRPGSPASIDLASGIPTLRVAIEVEGAELAELSSLTFTDVNTGAVFADLGGNRPGRRIRGADQEDAEAGQRSARVPPGDYFVTAYFVSGLSWSGLTTRGATSTGRVVHLQADGLQAGGSQDTASQGGAPVLTLHVRHGRTRVEGVATLAGVPNEAAMVLLVPAAYGSPANLLPIRRAQTASDGSFAFRNVPSGPYLLVSIAHGWEVDWRDPGTLAKYLAQGTPLQVPESGQIDQTLQSVEP